MLNYSTVKLGLNLNDNFIFSPPCTIYIDQFISAPPTIAPVDIVRKLKSIFANWIFRGFPTLKQNKFWDSHLWSRGYYIGTVSAETIQKYIQNQKLV